MDYISGDVIANGVKLHFYRTGGNKPSLVFLHGVTDDGLCFARTADVLSFQYDVIMVDLRGHGKSEAPETGYSLKDMTNEVAALIKELKLDSPILMGHSMGAITALTLAGLFPDIARAIIVEDPPPFWMIKATDEQVPVSRNPLARWIESNKRKTKEELFEEVRAGNPGWVERELEPWVNSKLRYSPKIVKLVEMDDLVTIGFEDLFKKIKCPTLIITADMNKGAILSEKDLVPLRQWIELLDVVNIEGAGHNIRRDQFEKYMETVQNYLT